MAVSTAEYLKALQHINFALTTGLQTTIGVLENFERLAGEQRRSMIKKMKELVESSHNLCKFEPTKH